MFNPANAADQIKKEYIGYISTTFHFRNQILQKKLLEELEKTVSNGPYVEIKDSFKSGKSIEKMIDEKKLSPLFMELESGKKKEYQHKLPVSRPLYWHQEEAIDKIVEGRNVVISTGTGSGKTNCFLIPVINELLREKERGTLNDGVRAIFIYPMNALANDQIKALREILMTYPDIRFGVYNGGTENREADAIKLYEAMYANEKYPELRQRLRNEEVSRDEMKKKPPHILFTNYAMLEHMLFRPGDDAIFTNSNFRFVVLDEAHVYAGATGIETAFLMGRLKGRIKGERPPQFILTSATLGDGSEKSNERVVEFAKQLTGCDFSAGDAITAKREDPVKSVLEIAYPIELFVDLANEDNFFEDVLKKYHLNFDYSQDKEPNILFEIISNSTFYNKMRNAGKLIKLDDLTKEIGLTRQQSVQLVSLCAKAQKNGKPLIDIRYHYFLRALDGCYLALGHEDSLSLVRKDYYNYKNDSSKMFEIAVCDDCGEIAIIGKILNGKLVRASILEDKNFYQMQFSEQLPEEEEEEDNKDNKDNIFCLCKSCGAIVPKNEAHNKWCNCGNTQKTELIKLKKENCLNCGGNLRRFNLGYDAATGVIATSLYEQIPEYTFNFEESSAQYETQNPFLQIIKKKKKKSKTGSQFLVFSDSRQGAAKFACFLGDMYKQFLRRRSIWNVVNQSETQYPSGICVNDFVGLLNNYFSTLKLFRTSNSENAENSPVENRRNAWVAVLDELHKSNRNTSLVSLGKIAFEYLGNSNEIVDVVVKKYRLSNEDAKNFLNYLAFEVVRSAAVVTDNDTDINDNDREYLYYSSIQKVITKYRDKNLYGSQGFMPTQYISRNGETKYYSSNKLTITKKTLNLSDEDAIVFLSAYWDYLVSDSNKFKLKTNDSKGFFIPAKYFNVNFGKNANLWKCNKCSKTTQFNIKNNCIQVGCNGKLEKLNSEEFCKENYYAMLYQSKRVDPLFVKEHTAQLAKREALDYQQQFIRKEINALSCSTTFEMGVDVGDLETVFLRNLPPLASNYAQRVGRAGRSINAAAFALTFARLSSHDFTFFDSPEEMINGTIYPPNFTLDNEKILKRHIYAIAISLYLRLNPDLYSGNNASKFINEKGYEKFIEWLGSKPEELTKLIKNSIFITNNQLIDKYINSYDWLEDFCWEDGAFIRIIREFENNVAYLKEELQKAREEGKGNTIILFERKLDRYERNDLIDFLVRGNILPKYGFPIDSVELTQNIASRDFRALNLSRDLSVAIAEYAPSGEVVADGGLYTSRYIRKPIVNKSEMSDFETAYLANCPECNNQNFSNMPVGVDGKHCTVCDHKLFSRDFDKSIEPRAGFITEEEVKAVPLSSQERKYKTEAIYIGDKTEKTAVSVAKYDYCLGSVKLQVESTANDSLVVKSTTRFYVCNICGYSIAGDEVSKLNEYEDYNEGASIIQRTNKRHKNPFGRGDCSNTSLYKYYLHHEFKTDVAKISFSCDTSDNITMLSVMYALLNSFANELNIERRDIKVCLTYKISNNKMEHQIIIYDAVPGGAGHSRRFVTEDGSVLRAVIKRAISLLEKCDCSPSCYRCLRNYENQKIHEILDRKKALNFLEQLNREHYNSNNNNDFVDLYPQEKIMSIPTDQEFTFEGSRPRGLGSGITPKFRILGNNDNVVSGSKYLVKHGKEYLVGNVRKTQDEFFEIRVRGSNEIDSFRANRADIVATLIGEKYA